MKFINVMAVWEKTNDHYVGDATRVVCVPIDRIIEVRPVHHDFVRKCFGYAEDDDPDAAGDEWTSIEVQRRRCVVTYFAKHDMKMVMRAIGFLNLNPDRTTCYVDDFTCKDCG